MNGQNVAAGAALGGDISRKDATLTKPEPPKVGDKMVVSQNGMGPLYVFKEGLTAAISLSDETIFMEVEIKRIIKPVVSFEDRVLGE